MEDNIDTDPFLQLLTDALRAGPGSPQWHQAVARVRAGETGQDDEYALLVAARENLASGKDYRQVRAGAGFTRKLLSNIDADLAARKKSPLSTGILSYAGAGLVICVVAVILFRLSNAGGPGSTEDLSNLFFSSTVLSASLEGPLPDGWRVIGSLPVDTTRGLVPTAAKGTGDFQGGGIVSKTGMNPADSFAVEATFQFGRDISDECIPQLFVTDDPEFDANRGTSPHELVWLVRGQQAQVALPDGQLTTASRKVISQQSIAVRIVVGATNAVVTCDGNTLWSGASELGSKPRYVGVRLLCRKNEKRFVVSVKQVRVLAKTTNDATSAEK